jgi:hypothetical protein
MTRLNLAGEEEGNDNTSSTMRDKDTRLWVDTNMGDRRLLREDRNQCMGEYVKGV